MTKKYKSKKINEFVNLVGSKSGRTLNISINDDIGDFWAGTDSETMASILVDEDIREINLDINSRGGDPIEGISMFNQLKNHPATVNTTITGQAASAAVPLFLAGDNRNINTGGTVLVHPIAAMMQGRFSVEDLSSIVVRSKKLQESMVDVIASVTGGDRKDVSAMVGKETTLTDSEALEMGFATSISNNESVTLENYQEVKFLNYKEDKLQDVLDITNKILNNKETRTEEDVMTKEFDAKLAEFKADSDKKISELQNNLNSISGTAKKKDEEIVKLQNTIVDMQTNSTKKEFENFVDTLIAKNKILPTDRELELQNLELRKNNDEMLDSYKKLLNSKPSLKMFEDDFAKDGTPHYEGKPTEEELTEHLGHYKSVIGGK